MSDPRGPDTMLAVRFVKTWNSYMAGDVATFPPAIARRLVARRYAEAINPAAPGTLPPEDGRWHWDIRPPNLVDKAREW
jgi:hypothetical protein